MRSACIHASDPGIRYTTPQAGMAELVDAGDLKSPGLYGRLGSNPSPGTLESTSYGNPHKANVPRKNANCAGIVLDEKLPRISCVRILLSTFTLARSELRDYSRDQSRVPNDGIIANANLIRSPCPEVAADPTPSPHVLCFLLRSDRYHAVRATGVVVLKGRQLLYTLREIGLRRDTVAPKDAFRQVSCQQH